MSMLSQNVFKTATRISAREWRRCMAKVAGTAEKTSRKSFSRPPVERDERGQIIQKKKDKNPGAFRAMSATQLTDPLFESDQRVTLRLPDFNPKTVTRSMVGKAAGFALTDNDPVRIFGLPKKMLLEFRILSTPCSVIRDITVDTVEMLEKARETSSLKTRAVLNGRAGCGKSFLLLQMVEHCIANDWIVVYIPRAVNLVNSTTPYEYDLRTQTYQQPAFAFQTLQRLQTVNSATLSTLTTHKKLVFEKREVPQGTSLFDLVGVALKDPASAPVILDALMSELSVQSKHPVLLAVDDFQALYCKTAYRDPHFSAIRPYHLAIPRLLLDFASGKRSFAKGAVLGAITNSDTTYKVPLELQDALALPYEQFTSPYDKRSKTLIEYTKGLRSLPVPAQLSIPEAASLFELWMKDKALVPTDYDEVFLAKYTESSGNARDFVWKGLLETLQT